jgi:hypothetical protein
LKSNPAPVTYYALDLEEGELKRTLGEITASNTGKDLAGRVDIKGICGTYSDGIAFVKSGGLTQQPNISLGMDGLCQIERSSSNDRQWASELFRSNTSSEFRPGDEDGIFKHSGDTPMSSPLSPQISQPPLHIMFLGSSIGNFNREDAAKFIRSLPLRPGDTLVLGLDHDNEKELVEEAYNDRKGYTARFIMNALRVAGQTLGNENFFNEGQWDYVNFYSTVRLVFVSKS